MHQRLVADSIRDQLTLLVSGGVALAEHVAKLIICGADGVGVDQALLAALECRLCPGCGEGIECPVHLDQVPVAWAANRIVNLIGSWHSQLLEVLGAMGLREVRRLRGETGRAMFFEDLERECLGPVFGERVESDPPVSALETLDPEPIPAPEEAPAPRAVAAPCASRFRNSLGKYMVAKKVS